MKPNLKIIASTTATAMLVWTALAQDAAQPEVNQAELHQRMGVERTTLLRDTAQVTTIIGLKVENQQNENIGRVQDLLLNLATGRIREVIVSSDDASGQILTAVPPQVLYQVASRQSLQLDATPAKFAAAPRYVCTPTDLVTESNQVVAAYDYFGQQSYFVANPVGIWTTNQNGTLNRDGNRIGNQDRNAAIDRHVGDDSNTIATRDPDGKETGNYYSNKNRSINSWSALGSVESARHLLGRPVRNLQNEKLGHVKNLMVDLAAGRIAGVIITSHGFLGMDAELSSAPVTAFHYDSVGKFLQLDATPEMLSLSPAFNEAAWQNFPLPGYLAGEYYPYRITPYNNSDAPAGGERSGSVTRTDDSRQLPALTQGSSATDEDIQARIRTALQNDAALSANARNIQIITQNGLVTLRGPVETSDEKEAIGKIAMGIATADRVDNELEVQLTTTGN